MPCGVCQIKFGGEPEEVLQLVHFDDTPSAPPGCVVVRLLVRPINPTDLVTIKLCRFSCLPPSQHPPVIGSEGFGLIDQVGEGVTKFHKGQRVVPLMWEEYMKSGQGSWQDYVVVKESDVVAIPDSISDEVAAQFVINPCAAFGLLDTLAVPKGEYVIQTAAASVVGSLHGREEPRKFVLLQGFAGAMCSSGGISPKNYIQGVNFYDGFVYIPMSLLQVEKEINNEPSCLIFDQIWKAANE